MHIPWFEAIVMIVTACQSFLKNFTQLGLFCQKYRRKGTDWQKSYAILLVAFAPSRDTSRHMSVLNFVHSFDKNNIGTMDSASPHKKQVSRLPSS
jgi:hypothetical protein